MGMDLVRKKRERGVILGGRFHGHVFFFQAEDGIRDKLVTGVQTCALPIYPASCSAAGSSSTMSSRRRLAISAISTSAVACSAAGEFWRRALPARRMVSLVFSRMAMIKIGRASCRERGEISVVDVSLKKKKM